MEHATTKTRGSGLSSILVGINKFTGVAIVEDIDGTKFLE